MKHARWMVFAWIAVFTAPSTALLCSPTSAQPRETPGEIRFDDERVIEVTINGLALRLQVEPGHTGQPIINPEIVEQLGLFMQSDRKINFGGFILTQSSSDAVIDFGFGPVNSQVAWSTRQASDTVDGVIGVHDLPYERVTFILRSLEPSNPDTDTPSQRAQSVQSFELKRRGSRSYSRVGAEIRVAKKRLFMAFSLQQAPNLITAPTANFLATHQDGGFVEGSEGYVDMVFGVRRSTREMRLAYPIVLGDLEIDRFAVRARDHGRASKVGEITADDPRFTEEGGILVSRRKRVGRPDRLTLLGRDQIAQCSRLTFDFERERIELSCSPGTAGTSEGSE